jgi:deazaflavin-dependent oxidoreductase (nitroreductase family)
MWGAAGLRALRLANPFVRLALETRAHPLLSRQLLVLSYRGRRSGRRFRIPLRYARVPDEGIVVLAIRSRHKQWWRSFAPTGEATLTLRGARLAARGTLAHGSRRESALAAYLVRYPRSARLVRDSAVVVFERTDG